MGYGYEHTHPSQRCQWQFCPIFPKEVKKNSIPLAHRPILHLTLQGTQRAAHQRLDGRPGILFKHLAHRFSRIDLLVAQREQG